MSRLPAIAGILAALVVLTALAAYLRDPPWIGGVTSGLGPWLTTEDGRRVRWTTGHATFYVPADVAEIAIPLRPHRPPPGFLPVTVAIRVDGRLADRVVLPDETWRTPRVAVGRRPTSRRFRRVELMVSRTWGEQLAGVLLGEIETTARQRRGAAGLMGGSNE